MIPANDFPRQWEETAADVLAAVASVGASGWYVLGENVREFEHALARYWGMDHAVGVGSGLDAIEIALRVLGCKAGDHVLTTPVSAFATTLAIVNTGATPVFADCDCTGLVDFEDCRRTLSVDRRIRFFVPVNLYGHALNIRELERLRGDFDIRIVEDCAQSMGARSDGRACGSASDIATTSFYPTKNLGALGDGGALAMKSEEHARAARILRDYGQSAKYRHEQLGYNSRLDEIHAAVLLRAFLPRLDRWNKRRREIAAAYRSGICHPRITVPPEPAGSESCYHLFPITVHPELKASAMAHLRTDGVVANEHYPAVIPDQPALRTVSWSGDVPRARVFCASQISLPIHPYLTDEEVMQVIHACNTWCK